MLGSFKNLSMRCHHLIPFTKSKIQLQKIRKNLNTRAGEYDNAIKKEKEKEKEKEF